MPVYEIDAKVFVYAEDETDAWEHANDELSYLGGLDNRILSTSMLDIREHTVFEEE